MLGHVLIIVSAIPSVIAAPNHAAMAPFILGLIFFGIGVGFFKTNISPLIAEQVSASRPSLRKPAYLPSHQIDGLPSRPAQNGS